MPRDELWKEYIAWHERWVWITFVPALIPLATFAILGYLYLVGK